MRTIKNSYRGTKIYQQKLTDLNSCDFGDLILHAVKILENNKDIKEIYSKNFKYILVDEYQDTNFIQSRWLNLLAKKNRNICCVGDDDQSIYSWRGAEIKNFLTCTRTLSFIQRVTMSFVLKVLNIYLPIYLHCVKSFLKS